MVCFVFIDWQEKRCWFFQEEKEVVFALQKDLSNKFSSECLHFFVCLFTFFVFVFSSLFKTFKELEKRLMHCEYHHCISASQSSEWFMICSNIFFLSTAKSVHFWSTSLNLVHPVSSFVLSQFNSHSFKVFSNFSCMFLNHNIYSNLNSNCYFCS